MEKEAAVPTTLVSTENTSETIPTEVAQEQALDETAPEETQTVKSPDLIPGKTAEKSLNTDVSIPQNNTTESAITDSVLSEQLSDVGPEVPLVENREETAIDEGICSRFMAWARGITVEQLFIVMIVCFIVFVLIWASFISENPIVMLTTLCLLAFIIFGTICIIVYKRIQEWLEKRKMKRQCVTTNVSHPERESASNETLPRSIAAEHDSTPMISSTESTITLKCPEDKTEHDSTPMISSTESTISANISEEKTEPQVDGPTDKLLAAKSSEEDSGEEKSVRQRHKSNEKTE